MTRWRVGDRSAGQSPNFSSSRVGISGPPATRLVRGRPRARRAPALGSRYPVECADRGRPRWRSRVRRHPLPTAMALSARCWSRAARRTAAGPSAADPSSPRWYGGRGSWGHWGCSGPHRPESRSSVTPPCHGPSGVAPARRSTPRPERSRRDRCRARRGDHRAVPADGPRRGDRRRAARRARRGGG